MTRNTKAGRETQAEAGLERIKLLEAQLAAAPVRSRQHRTLTVAIRSEADAYRKSLDDEQSRRRRRMTRIRWPPRERDL